MGVPFPKTFLTTCLGAGFGGAYIAMAKVTATGWGAKTSNKSPFLCTFGRFLMTSCDDPSFDSGVSCMFAIIPSAVRTKGDALIVAHSSR